MNIANKLKLTGIILSVAILVSCLAFLIIKEVNPRAASNTVSIELPKEEAKRADIIEGYTISETKEINFETLQQPGEKAILVEEVTKANNKDYQFLSINSNNSAVYQRYKLKIDDKVLASSNLNLKWVGKSNRTLNLYGWDYTKKSWVILKCTIGRDGDNSTVSVDLDYNTMVQDSVANIIVGTADKNISLAGKIPENNVYDFSFVWLTDTQYYSTSYPDIYNKMTKYIVDNAKEEKIVYGIHTGDVVDNMDDENQWENADQSMKLLEKAGIPYGVLAGNHDVGHTDYNYSQFYKYFGEKRFIDMPTYGGSPNYNRDHYDIVSAGGKNYIIVYLGWHIDDSSIQWANEVLKKNSDKAAIVATHAYINPRGTYIEEGSIINDKIVAPNNNVFLVLSGHYPGVAINQKRVGDHLYYEMLSDYQFNPEGGAGYLRMLRFDNTNDRIFVETYSPYKDDYNFYDDAKEQFVIPLNTENDEVNLNTDVFEIMSK